MERRDDLQACRLCSVLSRLLPLGGQRAPERCPSCQCGIAQPRIVSQSWCRCWARAVLRVGSGFSGGWVGRAPPCAMCSARRSNRGGSRRWRQRPVHPLSSTRSSCCPRRDEIGCRGITSKQEVARSLGAVLRPPATTRNHPRLHWAERTRLSAWQDRGVGRKLGSSMRNQVSTHTRTAPLSEARRWQQAQAVTGLS